LLANECMKLEQPLVRVAALLGCLGALLVIYFSLARPWFRRWGATDAEVVMALPGDDIVPHAKSQETRAITIAAPAARVWPWLAQIGQDRAGFYSYQLLENLFGCEMPNLEELDPRLQSWKLGDKLWMYPPGKARGIGFAVLAVHEPGRALGFATRQIGTAPDAPADGSWTFVVQPVDGGTSRLFFRGRAAGGLRSFAAVLNVAVFEPVHFAMERRTMEGVKALAEGRKPSTVLDNVQVALWTALFLAFVVSAVLVIAGRRPARHLATFVGGGLLFQFLTLVQPSPFIGFLLVLATVRPGVVIRSYEKVTAGRRAG
jgi:hypothetical protein